VNFSSDRNGGTPRADGRRSKVSMRSGGYKVALGVEDVVDSGVSGQKSLGRAQNRSS
jgi:hypothetical protein